MITFEHDISAPFLQDTNRLAASLLPTLILIPQENAIDVLYTVREYDQNQGREVLLSTNLSFDDNLYGQKWVFTVVDIISFYWQKDSNTIYYHQDVNGSTKLNEYWFLHTFLPIFFTIENKFELIHAGSVEINNRPILFIGPSYGGKSTLTDYFIQQGHAMISDDKVGLKMSNEIQTIASYPYHRPYREMEDLGIKVDNFMQETKSLHLIYALHPVDKKDKISFQKLKGIDTFNALQYNFDFNLPLNKARSFEFISKVAAQVEIYKLFIPWDLEQLDDVYKAICKHSNQRAINAC